MEQFTTYHQEIVDSVERLECDDNLDIVDKIQITAEVFIQYINNACTTEEVKKEYRNFLLEYINEVQKQLEESIRELHK